MNAPSLKGIAGIALTLALGGLVVHFAFGPSRTARGSEDDEESGPAIPLAEMQARVTLATAHVGDLQPRLHALGRITTRPEDPVSAAALAGGLVTAVEVQDGQSVESGAVLARLDDRPMREAVVRARAASEIAEIALRKASEYGLDAEEKELDLEATRASVAAAQARKEAERQRGLLRSELTSEKASTEAGQTADEAERVSRIAGERAQSFRSRGRSAEHSQLQAAVDQAKADLQAAERVLESAVIRAPRTGHVCGLSVSAGRVIEAGTTVARVVDGAGLAVIFELVPAGAARIRLGAQASVDAGTGEPLTGRVASMGGAVDPETGLVPVLVSLDASHPGPRIGETVYLDVECGDPVHGIVAPATALSIADDVVLLYTVDDHQIAHRAPVEVLARSADQAVITGDGVTDGARVIVDGSCNLPDGAHVVPEAAK